MKKKRKQISIILFVLLVLSFLLLLNDTLLSENDKKIYNISIITRGKNSESLMIMKARYRPSSFRNECQYKFCYFIRRK